jgi:hypothetical protein
VTASPRRDRVYRRLAIDLRRADSIPDVSRAPSRHHAASDYGRTSARTRVLVEWLRHLEHRSGFTDSSEVDQLRADLYRSLATAGTHDPAAVEVLIDQFHLPTPVSDEVRTEAAQALRKVASHEHHAELSRLAGDRSLGVCRAPLLEWLTDFGQPDGLNVITNQIDDPRVRATAITCLRRFRPTPIHLIGTVESFLDDPDPVTRHHASRTVAVLYAAVFAANSRAI